jgi:hypothetical protein
MLLRKVVHKRLVCYVRNIVTRLKKRLEADGGPCVLQKVPKYVEHKMALFGTPPKGE